MLVSVWERGRSSSQALQSGENWGGNRSWVKWPSLGPALVSPFLKRKDHSSEPP